MSASIGLLALALPNLDGIGKIAVFLIMLSVLVVLHEGGHFLLARLNGVRVNDFAVGFGPTLFKWTSRRSGTNYRINLLPIGGYCAMQGEDGKTSEAEQQRLFREAQQGIAPLAAGTSLGGVAVLERPATALAAMTGSPESIAPASATIEDNFQSKTPLQRLSIVVAGPIANFLLAFVIFFIAAITFGVASNTISPQIGILLANSPAQKAGLALGDRILAIDGQRFTSGDAIVTKIHASANRPLRLTYERHGETKTIGITPYRANNGHGFEGRIGFSPIPTFERVGPLAAVPLAAREFWSASVAQVTGYTQLISHPAKYASSVSGPIGMARAASAYQDLGWGPYLSLAAAISIALGVLNLLPFPALDGGRGVFIVAEMLRGRPVEPEKEALVHVTGFAVLMVLMVFVAYHDIANILTGKGVF
ncbi:MAG: RIP metalloprotease RseP [Vulcanimicrobiaceae bacterium]